jgi:putative oxidoreductase
MSGMYVDMALLTARIFFAGTMLFIHAWPKISGYSQLVAVFPDPIGLGSGLSLFLTLFAEGLCSALVLLGLFTRIALIPLITTMFVACHT